MGDALLPKIVVKLPDEWTDEDVIEHFQGINLDDGREVLAAMDLDVSEHDERATVFELTVTEVELDADGIGISYELEYEAYYGCRDMNYADSDERHISGQRRGNTFTFDRYVPPPRRSPYEEF